MARTFIGNFTHKDGTGYWLHDNDVNAQFWGWMTTAMHMHKVTLSFDDITTETVSADGQ